MKILAFFVAYLVIMNWLWQVDTFLAIIILIISLVYAINDSFD